MQYDSGASVGRSSANHLHGFGTWQAVRKEGKGDYKNSQRTKQKGGERTKLRTRLSRLQVALLDSEDDEEEEEEDDNDDDDDDDDDANSSTCWLAGAAATGSWGMKKKQKGC